MAGWLVAGISVAGIMGGVFGSQLPDTASARVDGATIELRVEPVEGRTVKGAIGIDLDEGWKTYWKAPGETGLPPSLDFSHSEGVGNPVVLFPAPVRFGEGDAVAAGYVADVDLPFELEVNGTTGNPMVELVADIGLCKEVCVPVRIDLKVSPPARQNPSVSAIVDRAFASVPVKGASSPVVSREYVTLAVDRRVGPDDVFVAGPDGWRFGRPIVRFDGTTSNVEFPVERVGRASQADGFEVVVGGSAAAFHVAPAGGEVIGGEGLPR